MAEIRENNLKTNSPIPDKKATNLEGDLKREDIEAYIDTHFEEILSKAELINAGNHGLIYKFNIEALGPLKQFLAEHQEEYQRFKDLVEATDPKVIKSLKVYNSGEGKREYEKQLQAYQLVDQADNPKGLTRVPKPLLFKDLKISSETQQSLNRSGASLIGDRVEIIVMDFAPGEDLATIFYRWVIEHHPQGRKLSGQVNFSQLQNEVAHLLKFEKPGGKHIREGDREYETRKVLDDNADRLYRFLKSTGLVIHPHIEKQIKNTFRIFHKNDLYHNDPHERNFVVNGNFLRPEEAGQEIEPPQVTIVDFGSSGLKDSERVDDSYIIQRLTELSKTSEEVVEERQKYFIKKFQTETELINKLEKWQKKYREFKDRFQDNKKFLEQKYQFSQDSEVELKEFILFLSQLVNDGLLDKLEARDFIAEKINDFRQLIEGTRKSSRKRLPYWQFNKLREYINLFE